MFNRQPIAQPRETEFKSSIIALPESTSPGPNAPSGPSSPPSLPAAKVPHIQRTEPSGLSIIGRDLTIMGERIVIVTKGTLQVDGEVHADLHGAEVIVGESGKVTGTIWADVVAVRGQVFGTIKGAKVELQAKSIVEGDIHHQSLVIVEGANFDGRVRRPKDAAELKPALEPDQHANLTPNIAA